MDVKHVFKHRGVLGGEKMGKCTVHYSIRSIFVARFQIRRSDELEYD